MESSHSSFKCTIPGSIRGTAPKQYGSGRRCRCGAKLTTYTKGEWCNVCIDNPDRKRHYTAAPKENIVEPETIKASVAAKQLGVTGKELKQLERDGRLTAHHVGRGLFGSTFLRDDVDRLKAELDADKDEPSLAEAAEKVVHEAHDRNGHPTPVAEPEPEFQIDQVTAEEDGPSDEALPCCGNKDDGGCFGPGCDRGDDPEGEPEPETEPTNAAESFESYARRRGAEFAEHYGKHLVHVDLARVAAADFRSNLELAQDYARNALRVQEELEKAGVKVEGIFGAPPYAATFDLDRFEDLDPEIRAMERVREALESLDRDAQIRVVRWALSKFGIDKPLPKPQVLDLSSDTATDAAPTGSF